MRRFGNVAVELGLRCGRRVERKLPLLVKIKFTLGSVRPRRPGIERSPSIRACLERKCLRLVEFAFILQIERKPGMKNLSAKVLAGRAAKIDVSQFISGETIPTAVVPWAGYQVV